MRLLSGWSSWWWRRRWWGCCLSWLPTQLLLGQLLLVLVLPWMMNIMEMKRKMPITRAAAKAPRARCSQVGKLMMMTVVISGDHDDNAWSWSWWCCFDCKLFCFKISLENLLHRASLERSEGNARLVDRQVSLFSKFQTKTSQWKRWINFGVNVVIYSFFVIIIIIQTSQLAADLTEQNQRLAGQLRFR